MCVCCVCVCVCVKGLNYPTIVWLVLLLTKVVIVVNFFVGLGSMEKGGVEIRGPFSIPIKISLTIKTTQLQFQTITMYSILLSRLTWIEQYWGPGPLLMQKGTMSSAYCQCELFDGALILWNHLCWEIIPYKTLPGHCSYQWPI